MKDGKVEVEGFISIDQVENLYFKEGSDFLSDFRRDLPDLYLWVSCKVLIFEKIP